MRSFGWGCVVIFTTASVHAGLPSLELVVKMLLLVV
jgi:hypothetical protein